MDEINIKLYLGRPNITDLEVVEYADATDFLEMCEAVLSAYGGNVFLIASEQDNSNKKFDQTFIDHDFDNCMMYIKDSILGWHYAGDGSFNIVPMSLWVYVHTSYEDAYNVALSMKEPTGLAY